MTAGQLEPGARFRQPATGLWGRVVYQGPAGTAVRIEGREVQVRIGARSWTRPAEVVTWSAATEVSPDAAPEGR